MGEGQWSGWWGEEGQKGERWGDGGRDRGVVGRKGAAHIWSSLVVVSQNRDG